MKKIIAFFLVICMFTVFAGCKDEKTESTKEENQINNMAKEKDVVSTDAPSEVENSDKNIRTYNESPEEVALLFSRSEKRLDFDVVVACIHPESELYQVFINDEDIANFMTSGKTPIEYQVGSIKKEYAEKGLTVADEEFVKQYYETIVATVQYSVSKVEQKSEDEVVVSVDVTKDVDHLADEPDFSILTLENTDVDKFVDERAIHYYTNHIDLKKYDGVWYVEDMMQTKEYGG